jgi:hypothetical protein
VSDIFEPAIKVIEEIDDIAVRAVLFGARSNERRLRRGRLTERA